MTDNDNDFTSAQSKVEDLRGFAEVEAAIREIDRLKGGEEEEEDSFEEKSLEDPQEDPSGEEEEVEETSDEEEFEEEIFKKESIKKPEKAWKEKKRRFKAQAETRAVLEEKRQILEENAQLKEMLRQAEAAGTFQYSKNAHSELEKAKNLHKQAVANGDDDALAEASIAIAGALYNIKELEKWSSYESSQPKKEVAPRPVQQQQEQQELEWQIAHKWLSTHSELQPNSKSYDQELAEEVAEYVYELDSEIDDAGKSSLKYSPQYFNNINGFIKDFQKQRRAESTKKNIGSMGNVGSVRNSYSNSLHSGPVKTQKISLTPYEKELAKIGGISEEEWAKRKNNISKMAR